MEKTNNFKLLNTFIIMMALPIFNANAQFGDIIKKLNEAKERILKDINQQPNSTESNKDDGELSSDARIKDQANQKSPEENINQKQLSSDKVAEIMSGRWGTDLESCERREGYYIRTKKDHNRRNSANKVSIDQIDRDGNVIIKKEYTEISNYFPANSIWQRIEFGDDWNFKIISNDKIELGKRLVVKENTNAKPRLEPLILIRCNYTQKQKPNDGTVTFGLKDFILGANPPKMGSESSCQISKFYEKTKAEICEYRTTLLEMPYYVSATIIDNIISSVRINDLIFYEQIKANDKKRNSRAKIDDKLDVIVDYSAYMNDLIKAIIEKNDIQQPSVTTSVVNSHDGLNNIVKLDQDLVNSIRRRHPCNECKSTKYEFEWLNNNYTISLTSHVPELKESPYIFYSTTIIYKYRDHDQKFNLVNSIATQEINRRREIESEKKQKIMEINNEKRKKDI